MHLIWMKRGPVWEAAQEGAPAAGGAQPAGGEPAQGEPGGEAKPAPGSIMDFAKPSSGDKSGEPSGEPWALPEGLDLPDHLVGDSAEDTLRKLSKAYEGARRDIAQKGKGQPQGEAPGSPEEYVIEATGEDDKIAAELNSEASKPIVDAFRAAAHAQGMSKEAFTSFMREGLSKVAEAGIPIGVSDQEAAGISGEAEYSALVQEVGKKEADTMLSGIENYIAQAQQRAILRDEDDVAEFRQMVGTARGAQIWQRIRQVELGEQPIPPAVGAQGQPDQEEAYVMYSRALAMPEGAERDAAVQAAKAALNAAYGDAKGSAVKSKVL
jgi:hypothetical protein